MLKESKVSYYDLRLDGKKQGKKVGFIVDNDNRDMAEIIGTEIFGGQDICYYDILNFNTDSIDSLKSDLETNGITEFSYIIIWGDSLADKNDSKRCMKSDEEEYSFNRYMHLILNAIKEKCKSIYVISPFRNSSGNEPERADRKCNAVLEKRNSMLKEIALKEEVSYIDVFEETQNSFTLQRVDMRASGTQRLKYLAKRIETEILSCRFLTDELSPDGIRLKLSVITVCYNSESTIEQTIKSVISQKNVDVEYIIVDGCSTDKTLQIVDRYKDKIAKVISEPDRGIFDAMNKGISLANGDIISFLNSDDWYEPNALYLVEQVFLRSGADIVVGNSYYISQAGEMVYYNGDKDTNNDIRVRMPYHHESIFARREQFKVADNFDLKFKLAADYDWFLRQFLCGVDIYRIDVPVFTFTYGGASSVNAIECAYEAKMIASNYAAKPEIRSGIDEHWVNAVAANIDSPEITEILKNKKFLRDGLLDNDKVYVWGTGRWAEKTIRLIEESGVSIFAYIDEDKDKQKSNFYGYKVIDFDNVPVNSEIIIATPKYEAEIRELLIQSGWDTRKIQSVNNLNKVVALQLARLWPELKVCNNKV